MANVARRLTILACVVLVLVALGISGFWLIGAHRLRDTVTNLETSWRAKGGETSHENFRLTGFPMWFRALVDKPVIGFPGAPSPWRWEGPPVRFRLSPFAPRGRALFPGQHRLDFTTFGGPVSLGILARDAEAQYRGARGEDKFLLHGDKLAVTINDQPPMTVERLDLDLVSLSGVTDHLKPSAQFAVDIDDVKLPPGSLPEQFRNQLIDLARLRGQVLGPLSPRLDRAAVTAWRDLGGTVEVASLELRWGPLKIVALGTAALDANLQPLAALTATITGFNEAIDALADAGSLDKNEAESAKSLFKLLAKPPLLGGPPEIAVPVTIQNQRLALGPVTLMTLPLIEWPN